MVLIDKETCTGCGSCVKICHEHCMSLIGKSVSIDYKMCSTCTQCIAICPRKALSWDGVPAIDFDPSILPSVSEIEELLAERRTIRAFTSEPVDRSVLEEIVRWGAYAPTHNFDFRCIAIGDPKVIEAFDRAAYRFTKRIYELIFHPRPIRWLVSIAPLPMQEGFNRTLPKLEAAIRRGRGYDSMPPALVCIVGDKRASFSTESAQYVLYNMALVAQVRGLGCRSLVGNQMIFNRSKEIRGLIGLKSTERIFAMAGFGHPSVRFRNKVPGRSMDLRWI